MPKDYWSTGDAEAAPHFKRGVARPELVLFSGEKQQERIATELDEAAAVVVRDVQQVDEAVADRRSELFGADLAVLSELLGEFRESRNVDEDERAFDGAVAKVGRCIDPLDDKARH